MSHRHADVLIVGGGPAGAAVAISLARLGHKPLLISALRRQAAIEGFSDRTMQALETLGFRKVLDSVGPKVAREAHGLLSTAFGNAVEPLAVAAPTVGLGLKQVFPSHGLLMLSFSKPSRSLRCPTCGMSRAHRIRLTHLEITTVMFKIKSMPRGSRAL